MSGREIRVRVGESGECGREQNMRERALRGR
jgi:hypothetical protein